MDARGGDKPNFDKKETIGKEEKKVGATLLA